jgi:outer membrane protein OmpA-like peptidoglycan-associated protein
MRSWVVILLALAPAVVLGQAEKVMQGKEIEESALVDALTPAEKPILTRSIRVSREGQAPVPVKQAAASLLITFETDSAKLTPKARQSLEIVARALKSDKLANFRFSIEGHADPRGGEELNLRLSQERAESVVSYLADDQKIERSRLQAIGKGQSELLNVSDPSAPENRRVTIKTVTE